MPSSPLARRAPPRRPSTTPMTASVALLLLSSLTSTTLPRPTGGAFLPPVVVAPPRARRSPPPARVLVVVSHHSRAHGGHPPSSSVRWSPLSKVDDDPRGHHARTGTLTLLAATPASASPTAPTLSDPASTTAELLAAMWDMIVNASDLERGEERTVLFPQMQDQISDKSYLTRLMAHLDVCKDICDTYGITTTLVPHQDGGGRVTGFTVKNYKKSRDYDDDDDGTLDDTGGYEFTPDPFWDEDFDPLSMDPMIDQYDDDEEEGGGTGGGAASLPEIKDEIPADDDDVTSVTKEWVSRMMSDMGVCPFTSGSDLAGLPMGNVFYTVDRSTGVEDVYARYWKEVVRVERSPEKELSTTLLILPEFMMHNVEGFESFSQTLTQPLESLHVEDLLQLVFFHPRWVFRDGSERMFDSANAANYARRSPWPMVNILRTKQVRAAQKGIPTGLVYQQNEKTLNAVGANKLERMLRLRDWDDLEGQQVNRRDHEALRIAQDLQVTGRVEEEDRTLTYDATPAANKVDRSQIEGGDMVNIIMQALEKRLFGGDSEKLQGDQSHGTTLSGAETSATMMASDFLLKELDRVSTGGPSTLSPIQEQTEMTDVDSEMSAMFGGSSLDDDARGE